MARRAAAAAPALAGATWTRNGDSHGTIAVPRGATVAHFATTSTAFTRGRVQFGRHGGDIGEAVTASPNSNGLELNWPTGRGLPIVQYAKSGLIVPDLYLAPAEANGLHIVWRGRRLVGVSWTRGGDELSPAVALPDKATDVHLHLIWR